MNHDLGSKVNVHAAPRITQIVVHVGVGKHRDDRAYLEAVREDLKAITGQAPHECRAKKAVSGFNVRQGNLVGLRVTLRGRRMKDFIRRLVHATLPRVRDFRGIPMSNFDGHGNLNIGLTEQLAFPEITSESIEQLHGLEVVIQTSANNQEEGYELLTLMGFPLQKKSKGRGNSVKK